MRSSLRNTVINVSLLLATIAIFFGGIEFALRVTGLQTTKPNPPKIYQSSAIPDIRYELKPSISERAYRSTVTTNSLGFRGPELQEGKQLIAMLGDSITFGYGLEDDQTLPAHLQALLPEFNVLNTASPGYNLTQQTAVFREKVKKLNPTTLVLIFHFNDLEESGIAHLDEQGILRPEGWTLEEEQCSPIKTGLMAYVPGKCWLDLRSAFYRAVKKFVTAQQGKRDLQEQEATAQENAFSENMKAESLKAYGETLAKLTALLPRDLPRLFVIWPERNLHFTAREQLKSLVEAQGFRVLDLYEVFGNDAETLSWDTVHPSAETAEHGADIIKAALEHYNLIPIGE
ncbi:MAG: GDSL-type esterase/lipase family protein [Candidatus Peregrinibacteria bacterium]|nr:GDSL-type esterase/lipase family protein [Candidatus Peregrinibacteria bacterium]